MSLWEKDPQNRVYGPMYQSKMADKAGFDLGRGYLVIDWLKWLPLHGLPLLPSCSSFGTSGCKKTKKQKKQDGDKYNAKLKATKQWALSQWVYTWLAQRWEVRRVLKKQTKKHLCSQWGRKWQWNKVHTFKYVSGWGKWCVGGTNVLANCKRLLTIPKSVNRWTTGRFFIKAVSAFEDYLNYRWQTVIENVVFSKSSSSKSSFEKWKSCDNSSFWGRGQRFLSLSSTFTLWLPLSISLHLCLSLSLTHMHKQPRKLWPISHHHCLAGQPFFVSLQLFTPSLIPISNRQLPPTHPHLTHPLLPLPPLTVQKRGVIFRAQLTV